MLLPDNPSQKTDDWKKCSTILIDGSVFTTIPTFVREKCGEVALPIKHPSMANADGLKRSMHLVPVALM